MKKGKINNVMFYIIFFAILVWLLLIYYDALVDQGRAESIDTLRKRIENRIGTDTITILKNNDTRTDSIN